MLNWFFRLFRSNSYPPAKAVEVQHQSPPPTQPSTDVGRTVRERDDAAWERYDDRVAAGKYSWTYDGTTVTYTDKSWEYHEPDTYRPKPLSDRFYNEVNPEHVNELLEKWAKATQKGRVREHLERAAEVAYMRRKHSGEARALGNLLTKQCIEIYPERCSWGVYEWRAKLLAELGLVADALELLKQYSETCKDDFAREKLLKTSRALERGLVKKKKRTHKSEQPSNPSDGKE
jgi:hypothetical protein